MDRRSGRLYAVSVAVILLMAALSLFTTAAVAAPSGKTTQTHPSPGIFRPYHCHLEPIIKKVPWRQICDRHHQHCHWLYRDVTVGWKWVCTGR